MAQIEESKEVIVVTGSSGLIGSRLIRDLARQYHMIGFDRAGDPYPPIEAESVSVDVTDAESIRRGLERVRYAYGDRIASVVHLAAYYDFAGEPSPLYEKVTVEGTRKLLRALQNFNVEQFIFSSTMLVHAPTEPGQPLDEDWPIEAKWDYPQSKVETERVIHEEHGDIPTLLLRIAGVYTDECDSIPIAQQIRRIYENQITSHLYPGDLSHGQSFVHLQDTVDAIKRAIERRHDLPAEVPLLLGEPDTYSYGQLQETIAQLIHGESDWSTETIPAGMAKAGAWMQDSTPATGSPFIKPWMIDLADDHYELNIDRARELLGWKPQHRLIDTLPKMIEALKRDPLAWYEQHDLEPTAALKRREQAAQA